MSQSPYYYGVQRKALTGMGYGPYYGERYRGGQGTPTELAEKYAVEPAISTSQGGTPAISRGEGLGEQPGGKPNELTKSTDYMFYEGQSPQEAWENTKLAGRGVRKTLAMTTGVGAAISIATSIKDILRELGIKIPGLKDIFGKSSAQAAVPFAPDIEERTSQMGIPAAPFAPAIEPRTEYNPYTREYQSSREFGIPGLQEEGRSEPIGTDRGDYGWGGTEQNF